MFTRLKLCFWILFRISREDLPEVDQTFREIEAVHEAYDEDVEVDEYIPAQPKATYPVRIRIGGWGKVSRIRKHDDT